MSTHTPGPWDRGPYVGDNIHVITTTDQPWVGRIVAKVPASEVLDGEANARLIAAAPELLAALMAVVAMYGPSADYGHEARATWEQAEAAIAKAEGR